MADVHLLVVLRQHTHTSKLQVYFAWVCPTSLSLSLTVNDSRFCGWLPACAWLVTVVTTSCGTALDVCGVVDVWTRAVAPPVCSTCCGSDVRTICDWPSCCWSCCCRFSRACCVAADMAEAADKFTPVNDIASVTKAPWYGCRHGWGCR